MHQNIWDLDTRLLQRQKRRAQLVKRSLQKSNVKAVLDIGCSEGYATSFISETSPRVVGIELNMDTLRIAKNKISQASFVNASIDYLPFRKNCFDAICILEVLEHLPEGVQEEGLREANRVLCNNAIIIISTPYNEEIIYTRCIHCERTTPLWGHLHRLNEDKITSLLPSNFSLIRTQHLPNIGMVSCLNVFDSFPLVIWLLINNTLGLIRKGYWIVVEYIKTDDITKSSDPAEQKI